MHPFNPLRYFRGQERYNCAQAILKTFDVAAGLGPGCIERFSKLGGGRAPGGECGALFAAKSMLASPSARRRVEDRFVAKCGAVACRAIRQGRRVSCQECVQVAADELLAQFHAGEALAPPAQCVQQ
jgi:hypothetical protein